MASALWRRRIPAGAAVGLLTFLAAVGFSLGYLLFTHRPGPTAPPTVRGPLPRGSYPEAPLAPGTPAPPIAAAGWVNGPPPAPGADPSPRLIVLDIWAHWCPACRETAPGLVRAYHKFRDRGVAFVSLTNVAPDGVEEFAGSSAIPWPCGYGAALEDIAAFGAYSADRMTPTYNPGYEVTPTLYLIGPDGLVLWHDGQSRPRHLKTATQIVRELDAEIERQLMALDQAD